MGKYTIYAISNGEEYAWVIGKKPNDLEDIFCAECMYDLQECGYDEKNCPFRQYSKSKYLEKHGKFIDRRK